MSAPENSENTPFIEPLDLGLLAGIPMLSAVAWLLPPRMWDGFAYGIAPRVAGLLSRGPEDIIGVMRKYAGKRTFTVPPEEAARQMAAAEIVSKLQIMRDHLSPGWHPRIAVDGLEHLNNGLRANKGVILWDSHFYFASLITKIAMKQAGHDLIHLSQPGHGFSGSKFGMRVYNPLQTRTESRYVGKRVVLSPGNPTAALRALMTHLARNAVVSVTVRPSGARPVDAPFMEATYTIAGGAPFMAHACGAALLPVFTLRTDDGSFRVVIDEPLDVDPGADRKTAVKSANYEYARRLEPFVLENPGLWIEWLNI